MKSSGNNEIVIVADGIPLKIRKNLGFGFIIASLFFLFNPDFMVFDILPDIIGYMLMCAGISSLATMNESFELASEKFKKLIIVGVAKIVSVIVMFSIFDAKNMEYGYLLYTFSFLVVDLIYVIPAFKYFFEGLIYITERHKCSICAESVSDGTKTVKKRKNRNSTERVMRLTLAFVVIKPLLSALPEFIVLGRDDYVDNMFFVNMYNFIDDYRILSGLIVFIIGTIWLIKTCNLLCKIIKDREFINTLKGIMKEKVVPREGIFIRRALKTALLILGAGAVLCVDFHVSELNILPDIFAAVMFFISAYILRHYVKSHKKVMISSLIYFLLSAAASVLRIVFLSKYDAFSAVNHQAQAASAFYVMCASTIIENIGFVAMAVCLLILLRDLIRKYTGYVSIRTDYTSESRLKAIHRELSAKLWIVGILAVLGAVSASLYDIMLPERHNFAQIVWVIDFVCQGLFAIMFIRELFAIGDEVDSRYMLD